MKINFMRSKGLREIPSSPYAQLKSYTNLTKMWPDLAGGSITHCTMQCNSAGRVVNGPRGQAGPFVAVATGFTGIT